MSQCQPRRPDYLEAVKELHDRMPFAKQLGIVLDQIESAARGRPSGSLVVVTNPRGVVSTQ